MIVCFVGMNEYVVELDYNNDGGVLRSRKEWSFGDFWGGFMGVVARLYIIKATQRVGYRALPFRMCGVDGHIRRTMVPSVW